MTNTSPASQEGLGTATVISVDYAVENAIQTAIDANAFDDKYISIDMNDIPVGGTGQAEHEVFELHLDREIYSRDLPDELDRNNVAFADPLTALRYAKELPDRQRKYPLAILFNSRDQLCCLILRGRGGERCLRVGRGFSYGRWRGFFRFLVVRKSSV